MNLEVFLPLVANRPVDAVLVKTRIAKIGKFLCREYHRHLVDAYEAAWAVTDSMRRYYPGKPASSWHITTTDLAEITSLAAEESDVVKTVPYYWTLRFVQLVRKLEVSGLAPHYQPMRDRMQSFASEMFEIITSEYVKGPGRDSAFGDPFGFRN